ncbi:MAG TPA: PIG-L family deacetylase, partial [Caldilineaceae bacterium]|nr:PIG-L family deacetylase [Caldilineaceae bacterium]
MNAHSAHGYSAHGYFEHGYEAIYLSPHLDDVALSCGGQIFQQTQAGARLLIVTVMAGDPPAAVSGYARSLHERWAVEEATAARRAEDLAACRILGAEPLHWPIPDCIYRCHPLTGKPFYLSDDDLFGEAAAEEAGLAAELAERLAALPPHGRLVAPLAVGHHVDHQLVRQAAELACGPERLLYYEDYPYAQLPGKLAHVVGDGSGWQAEVVRLTP